MNISRLINFICIIVGGVIAIYAQAEKEQNTYLLMGGIILLMFGIYRTSRNIPSNTKNKRKRLSLKVKKLMKIKIGDKVETIDDAIIGTVIRVNGGIIAIEDADGFEFLFETNELMIVASENTIENSIYNSDIESIKKEKETIKRKASPSVKPKERHAPKFEVDLHIHHLVSSTKGMTNFDMLNLQLDTARRQLEFAIKRRIPKMVIIHGVGEGVLRQELETLLGRYNNVKFYDADYKTYGLGATEVRIFQNIEP